MVMIGQWYDKNVNDGWFCLIIEQANNSARNIEELLVELVP